MKEKFKEKERIWNDADKGFRKLLRERERRKNYVSVCVFVSMRKRERERERERENVDLYINNTAIYDGNYGSVMRG